MVEDIEAKLRKQRILGQSCGSRPETQAVTSIVHVQDVKISLKGKEQLAYSEAQTKQTLWPQQCIVSTCVQPLGFMVECHRLAISKASC